MSGPCASQTLADHGADVIKVEPLPHGDPIRRIGNTQPDEDGGTFLLLNRGKKSVAIDLRSRKGKDLVLRLAESADVLMENFRPGVIDEMGFGYDQLANLNPGLIYLSVSAFGSEGPWQDAPGLDPVLQAMSGVMSVTGEHGGEPLLVGVPIADFTGAAVGVQAVLLALLARQRTGRGQKVEVSMLAALMSSLSTRLAGYWYEGRAPERLGNKHSMAAPYQAFKTSDGWIMACGFGGTDAWPKFCQSVELPQLENDSRFMTNSDRMKNRAELDEILDRTIEKKSTAYWQERFRASGALFGPIYSIPQALEQEQVQATSIVTSVQHPSLGEIPQIKPAVQLSQTPGAIGGPPPLLGEHTYEVLQDLGLSKTDIAELRSAGTVAAPPEAG